jgi:hypothetical protein
MYSIQNRTVALIHKRDETASLIAHRPSPHRRFDAAASARYNRVA